MQFVRQKKTSLWIWQRPFSLWTLLPQTRNLKLSWWKLRRNWALPNTEGGLLKFQNRERESLKASFLSLSLFLSLKPISARPLFQIPTAGRRRNKWRPSIQPFLNRRLCPCSREGARLESSEGRAKFPSLLSPRRDGAERWKVGGKLGTFKEGTDI